MFQDAAFVLKAQAISGRCVSTSLKDVPSYIVMLADYRMLQNAHEQVPGDANGDHANGLQVCKPGQEEGMEADVMLLFSCAFKACASIQQVQLLHTCIVEDGSDANTLIDNAFLDLYVKFGTLEDAVTHFEKKSKPDVFLWNTLISVKVDFECSQDALWSYVMMRQAGTLPNDATYVHVLCACAEIGALEEGKLIHSHIKQEEIESHPFIKDALIDMYAQCASLEDALKIFHEAPHECTVVSWCAIISRCVECGQFHEALQLFKQMREEGVQPDKATYACMLQACCCDVAGLEEGRHLHAHAVKQGYELVEEVGVSLLEMYVSCGKGEEATHFFHAFPKHNSAYWCVMIAGCAQQGDNYAALQYFEHMKHENLKPSDASFLKILIACNSAGLVELGSGFFKSMVGEFGMLLVMEQYVCMVDCLGHMGLLCEAEDLILQMPHIPETRLWVSLLGACAKCSNMDVGERAFACFVSSNPEIAAGYKLMANIYIANLKREKVEQVHKMLAC